VANKNKIRQQIKRDLTQCTVGQQRVFKQMYARGDLALPLDDVVDLIPPEKLKWAWGCQLVNISSTNNSIL
jgi:hypothetical protein